jgi:four helix bundle protein
LAVGSNNRKKILKAMKFRELKVYQKAFALAIRIYDITNKFPVEERYALVDQVRRSSRSVCTNIAEGYRKRQYQRHFVSKLTDTDAENSETFIWLEFSLSSIILQKKCSYR